MAFAFPSCSHRLRISIRKLDGCVPAALGQPTMKPPTGSGEPCNYGDGSGQTGRSLRPIGLSEYSETRHLRMQSISTSSSNLFLRLTRGCNAMDTEDEEEELDEVGFAKAVLDVMKKERAELLKAGLDVDHMIEEIEKVLQEAEDAKARVEDIKRQMLMEMSKSLIKDKSATLSSAEKLDMAVETVRRGETTEDYYKRVKRRGEKPRQDSNDA